MPQATWLVFAGLAKESTWGTPVAATTFYPVRQPKFTLNYETIIDDGYRSNAAKDQAWYQGPGWTAVETGDMSFYPDDTGHVFMGLLGADAITGAGPYTHAVTLLNTALPPSYTLVKFDNRAATADQVAGAYFEEAVLKFTNNSKQLLVAAKGRGKIQTTVAKPTNTYSAAGIYLPWQGALTFSGSSNLRLIDMNLTIRRPVDLIFGLNNSQDATGAVVGQIEVTGKVIFALNDNTEFAYYTGNTQPTFSLVFTSGTNTLTLQMSKLALESPTVLEHTRNYEIMTASIRAVANATDAGTGNSPIKATLVNGKAAAY